MEVTDLLATANERVHERCRVCSLQQNRMGEQRSSECVRRPAQNGVYSNRCCCFCFATLTAALNSALLLLLSSSTAGSFCAPAESLKQRERERERDAAGRKASRQAGNDWLRARNVSHTQKHNSLLGLAHSLRWSQSAGSSTREMSHTCAQRRLCRR